MQMKRKLDLILIIHSAISEILRNWSEESNEICIAVNRKV